MKNKMVFFVVHVRYKSARKKPSIATGILRCFFHRMFFLYLQPVNALSPLQSKIFSNQNKGHLGSRYSGIYGPFVTTSTPPSSHPKW